MTAATGGRLGRRRSRFDPQRIAGAERQVRALRLRALGYSYAQIADAAGYNSRQAAHKAIMSALARPRPASRAVLNVERMIDLERVDALFAAIYPAACDGNTQAIAVVVGLMERRARYLGLDVPEKRELTGKDGAPLQVQQPPSLTVQFVPAPPKAGNEALPAR